LEKYPNLILELIPESRDLSLTRWETDIAVRLARPITGGTSIKARRIGTLNYAAYVSTAVRPRDIKRLPWITFDDTMSHLPQAQWIARAAKGERGSISRLKIRDATTAIEVVAGSLGKTLLPTLVADRDGRLRRLEPTASQPWPTREIWLLVHADQTKISRVSVAIEWIEKVVGSARRE
jgi:DNA-binding transcriptional LysR family regulator